MYLKDALFQCSRIVGEVADVYAELATLPATDAEKAEEFRELVRREADRARLLKALGELFSALGDDGPFLVQARSDLSSLRRLLENARKQLHSQPPAGGSGRCLELLDSAPRREVVVGLLECAEPELCRVLRVIDSESRAVRKSSATKRSSGARPARGGGAEERASPPTPAINSR